MYVTRKNVYSYFIAQEISTVMRFFSRNVSKSARRSSYNYGNSYPRNVASSRAAPAVLALLVLFEARRHSSCSSFSSSSSYSSLSHLPPAPLILSFSLSLSFDRVYLALTIFPYHCRSPCSSLVTACCSDPLLPSPSSSWQCTSKER